MFVHLKVASRLEGKGLFAPQSRAKHGQDLVCTVSRTQKLERMPAAVVLARLFLPLSRCQPAHFQNIRNNLPVRREKNNFPINIGEQTSAHLRAPAPARELD